MFERKMFLAGSWGADFHPDLQPREDETVLLPHVRRALVSVLVPLALRSRTSICSAVLDDRWIRRIRRP